jgi:hypothetical protein
VVQLAQQPAHEGRVAPAADQDVLQASQTGGRLLQTGLAGQLCQQQVNAANCMACSSTVALIQWQQQLSAKGDNVRRDRA